MGNKKNKQLIILVAILVVTGFISIHLKGEDRVEKSVSLSTVLDSIPEYKRVENIVVPTDIITALRLDDVAQKRYFKDNFQLDLYIGYYFSTEKISAAHSPLVCMPGQGWVLQGLEETSHQFASGGKVDFAKVIAQQGEIRFLTYYWFQAYDQTAPNMTLNIYNALKNIATGKPREHAFIRITIPVTDGIDEARAEGEVTRLIEQFYPVFLDYIEG